MNTRTQALHDAGQSLWLDNITRTMLDDGTLARYIAELSVTGLTSNPTIFENAIGKGDAYDGQVQQLQGAGLDAEGTFFELAIADLQRAADAFAAVHERSAGLDGFVSLEVSPELAYDTEATIAQAKDLHARMGRPNVYIKIPGTPEGLPAIEAAIHAGIPVNVTLLFSSEHHLAAAGAHLRGLERRVADGLAPDVPSVASLFMSRWDKAVAGTVPAELENRLGLAIGGRAYRAYREFLASDRVQRIMNAGAVPQRLLWASTGTKDPNASDTLFIDGLVAPFTVNTMPEGTLLAYADHAGAPVAMAPDGGDAEATLSAFAQAGIDVEALAARLQQEGADAFVASWRSLVATLDAKHAALSAS
jgi:transaldolase